MSDSIETQVQRLRQVVADFRAAIETFTPAAFLSPLGNWSPRDIVAHLIGWNRGIVRGCKELLEGELPFYDLDPGEDYSNVNARLVAEHSSESRADLLADLELSARELEHFLHTLSTEQWARDSGVRHQGEVLTIRGTVTELVDDYLHHLEQLRDAHSR